MTGRYNKPKRVTPSSKLFCLVTLRDPLIPSHLSPEALSFLRVLPRLLQHPSLLLRFPPLEAECLKVPPVRTTSISNRLAKMKLTGKIFHSPLSDFKHTFACHLPDTDTYRTYIINSMHIINLSSV